jgi:hypothetical protein
MDAATTQPGVRPFDMTGRPMRGIVVIDRSGLDDQAPDRSVGQPAATWRACRRGSPVTSDRSPQQPPPRLRDARLAA